MVSGRWGSSRDSANGHPCIFATSDNGLTWHLRYDGYQNCTWGGLSGEIKGLTSTEVEPGKIIATALWVDRSDPDLPFINPRTQGLLPMRIMHVTSADFGFSWESPVPMDTTPHLAASPCSSHILRLPSGILAQPYEQWKEYNDDRPGKPGARLRFSEDGGQTWPKYVTVAQHPKNQIAYWDQRLSIDPNTGNIVAMFWTHNFRLQHDIDIHISYGSPDGQIWTIPRNTTLPGQHCQPLCMGNNVLLAVYSRRRTSPAIVLSISRDLGKSWDHQEDVIIYDSTQGPESGAEGSRTQSELWGDMEKWRFGHPRMVKLPNNEVFITYYGGTDSVQTARWARVRL